MSKKFNFKVDVPIYGFSIDVFYGEFEDVVGDMEKVTGRRIDDVDGRAAAFTGMNEDGSFLIWISPSKKKLGSKVISHATVNAITHEVFHVVSISMQMVGNPLNGTDEGPDPGESWAYLTGYINTLIIKEFIKKKIKLV